MAASAPAARPPWARLWRYNYAILMGTGYWLLVLPVAASQIVTLWMFAMGKEFGQLPATRIGELMAPVLSAFLVAHSMAPEYRSGVGAVLACKPVSLHRVVTLRVALAMLLAMLLTTITLTVCSQFIAPVDVAGPLLATLPGVWFLSLLALTFATTFRNALAGFGAAAGLWALDFAVGYSVHPFLSVQGMTAKLDADALGSLWIPSKATMLVAGTLLLLLHGRLIHRVCRAPERSDLLRIVASIAALMLCYAGTGAAATVSYAYANRGNLELPDVVWLRARLRLYGPLPVSSLFGRAFHVYVSEPGASREGSSVAAMRVQQLRQAVARWGGSMWADSIAFDLAGAQERADPPACVKDYLAVADRFPASPFAPQALWRIVTSEEKSISEEPRLSAARRILAEYDATPQTEAAAEKLKQHFPGEVPPDELARGALVAAQSGARHRKPTWLVLAARVLADAGNTAEGVKRAREAREVAEQLLEEDKPIDGMPGPLAQHRGRITGAMLEAIDLVKRLEGEQAR